MSRIRKIVTSAGVLLLLGVGWAYAGPAGNPLQQILNSVLRVEDQTAGIAADTSKIAEQTSGVLPALDSVVAKLDKLEQTGSTPSIVHRVWLSPYWEDAANLDDVFRLTPAQLSILNPGNQVANVGCTFFDQNGSLLIDRGGSFTVSPGAAGVCSSFGGSDNFGRGWMLVTSDQPVLPYGFYGAIGTSRYREDMAFRPIDCSSPYLIEYVCQFVSPNGNAQ